MRMLANEAQQSQRLVDFVMSLPMSSYGENVAAKMDQYLRDHFFYMPENIETLVAPEYMLLGLANNGVMSGDCDDISTLQGAVYKCLSIPVRYVAIRSDSSKPDYDHVFCEVKVNNDWIVYDVTLPLGFQIDYVARVTMEV